MHSCNGVSGTCMVRSQLQRQVLYKEHSRGKGAAHTPLIRRLVEVNAARRSGDLEKKCLVVFSKFVPSVVGFIDLLFTVPRKLIW